MEKIGLGLVIGHRMGAFPDKHPIEARKLLIKQLEKLPINLFILPQEDSPLGAVASLNDAKKYADYFSKNRNSIQGVILSLADFGDEGSLSSILNLADLNVPVFVHAFADDPSAMSIAERKDAFCGKFSLCNNLMQNGVKFTLGENHVESPDSKEFLLDIQNFIATCRVVHGLKHARIGCIGARTPNFKTMRFNEKLLQRNGITVETCDLSSIIKSADSVVKTDTLYKIKNDLFRDKFFKDSSVPETSIDKIVRFSIAIEAWVKENSITTFAIQCWPSLQDAMGIYPCTIMSALSDEGIPAACETDVMGALSMLALQLASTNSSALFDLNNNGSDKNEMVLFHCSNSPKSMMQSCKATCNAMDCKGDRLDSSYSTLEGKLKTGEITMLRVSDSLGDKLHAYCTTADITDKSLSTFGTYGVIKVDRLQELLNYGCSNGFEHHIAINYGDSKKILDEAFNKYLKWDLYVHGKK